MVEVVSGNPLKRHAALPTAWRSRRWPNHASLAQRPSILIGGVEMVALACNDLSANKAFEFRFGIGT